MSRMKRSNPIVLRMRSIGYALTKRAAILKVLSIALLVFGVAGDIYFGIIYSDGEIQPLAIYMTLYSLMVAISIGSLALLVVSRTWITTKKEIPYCIYYAFMATFMVLYGTAHGYLDMKTGSGGQTAFFATMALIPCILVVGPYLTAFLEFAGGLAYSLSVHYHVRPLGANEWVSIVTFVLAMIGITFAYYYTRQDFYENRLRLYQQSYTDELSGLYNRRRFEADFSRYSAKPYSLIMGDIDNFKKINDTHGHPYGDKAIVKVGSVLEKYFAHPYRYGGDEFLILSRLSRQELIKRIGMVNDSLKDSGISLSFGLCFDAPKEEGQSIRLVDETLMRAKKDKTAHYAIAEDSLD